ncbi:MAG: PilZ domain-containing protein [Acidobacteriia bacterium]|nr:PilZ domain-containing protein [Terriglobia bacterium]
MQDRRSETRLMCADMVEVQWKEDSGDARSCTGLLEDISPSGACLQLDSPLPLGKTLEIQYRKVRLQGSVCYCFFRDIGYWIGVQFSARKKWSRKEFRPKHLLDPRKLLARSTEPRKGVQ